MVCSHDPQTSVAHGVVIFPTSASPAKALTGTALPLRPLADDGRVRLATANPGTRNERGVP